jgi:hypothetical protein
MQTSEYHVRKNMSLPSLCLKNKPNEKLTGKKIVKRAVGLPKFRIM